MNPWTKFVQNISAKLAFFPPSPTYEVLQHSDGTGQLYIQPKYSELPRVLSCTVKKLKTKKRRGGGGGDEIIAAFIPYVPRNGIKRVDTTILYSHGNAVDLGQLMPFYKDLSRALKANIMAYDYTGYGGSTGQATVQNTLADVEAVFNCLQHDFSIKPAQIIAYGQSVGSGPTAWLAATYKGLAGVVMHTPLLSGIRVLNPGLKWWPNWADVYPNHVLVSKIESPVLVLHGTEDEVIHFSHGKRMHELARNKVEPLWAIGFNHQNLELCPQYLPRLRRFIADLFPAAPATPSAATTTLTPPPVCDVAVPESSAPGRSSTPANNPHATWSVPTSPAVCPPPRRSSQDGDADSEQVPLRPLLIRPSRTDSAEDHAPTPPPTRLTVQTPLSNPHQAADGAAAFPPVPASPPASPPPSTPTTSPPRSSSPPEETAPIGTISSFTCITTDISPGPTPSTTSLPPHSPSPGPSPVPLKPFTPPPSSPPAAAVAPPPSTPTTPDPAPSTPQATPSTPVTPSATSALVFKPTPAGFTDEPAPPPTSPLRSQLAASAAQ